MMAGDTVELYLGVDGGFSGTRALLIDARGIVHGYGSGGNANHQGLGYDVAVGHVVTAVREACAAADVQPERLSGAYLALAGDDMPDDERHLLACLHDQLPGLRAALSNDVWAGLRAGSVTGVGVASNCGSGCGVVGRNGAGRKEIIPDLGYVFGDSGGGAQIATDAFRAVIRAWDGRGAPTALTPLVLDLTGKPDVGALYLAIYREEIGRQVFRAATRLVFQAAAAGDTVARGILERIGDELGVAAVALVQRLGLHEQCFPYVLTGGAFRTLNSPLAGAAISRVRGVAPGAVPMLPLLMPVAGAALLALDEAGQDVTPDHYTLLREQGYGWHPEETHTAL